MDLSNREKVLGEDTKLNDKSNVVSVKSPTDSVFEPLLGFMRDSSRRKD